MWTKSPRVVQNNLNSIKNVQETSSWTFQLVGVIIKNVNEMLTDAVDKISSLTSFYWQLS